MPIIASEIQFRLSGGAANADANASLGGAISANAVSGTSLNNLFDDITGEENAASEAEYRCFYVRNGNATLTLQNAVIYVTNQVAGGALAEIGVGTAALGGTEQTVANENTAPTGVTYSAPATRATGLALGNIGPSSHKAVWVRRTAANSAAVNNDGFTWEVAGDTAA